MSELRTSGGLLSTRALLCVTLAGACLLPGALVAGDESPSPAAAEPRVRLEFRDQDWLPALVWLAEQLHLNLDYQQLPSGTFNLVSTQDYSVLEAEDLINMQLLARGFTLLKRGEILRLAPLEGLDITLVPRIEEAELANVSKHQVVRVSFTLDWMLAEEAAAELKPLLSPYGQLHPMASSNRLEAMDVVINLREIQSLLRKAESDESRRERVEEFPLKHRSAADVAVKVRSLLGLAADQSDASSRNVQLDIEEARFKAEAVKQLGRDARELLAEKKEREPTVRLIVNKEENSLLVHARPDKLELVRQAIEAMDKPQPPTESTWETLNRVKMYPVEGFDPSTISRLLTNLQERGNLSPETRIQYEPSYNRIVAIAPPSDQLMISQLIDSFRLAGRQAYVLPLTQVEPMYAVRAIELVLFDAARKATTSNIPNEGQLRVEADQEHRRLLLWATPEEFQEVRGFLVQLGEIDATLKTASHMGPQFQRINLRGKSLSEVADQLEVLWKSLGRSPMRVVPHGTPEANSSATAASTAAADLANSISDQRGEFLVVSQRAPADEGNPSESAETAQAASSVRIVEGVNGDAMVVADDPTEAALVRQLLEQLLPSEEDVQVIEIQHAQASAVKRQLDTVLQHTTAINRDKLSTAKPLLIEVDSRTNRLLIQHASEQQMRIIQQLLPVLDKPEREDERLLREQRTVRIENRRAEDVAQVVKDVYRDLLSVNDSTFADANKGQMLGYNRAMAASNKNPEYQGLLSVGVDKAANSLIVSAPRYLMPEVIKLIQSVDTSDDGEAVAVVPFRGKPTDTAFAEAISRILRQRRDDR
jgi:type II secretory pathway component GspD/PulD (secretin)